MRKPHPPVCDPQRLAEPLRDRAAKVSGADGRRLKAAWAEAAREALGAITAQLVRLGADATEPLVTALGKSIGASTLMGASMLAATLVHWSGSVPDTLAIEAAAAFAGSLAQQGITAGFRAARDSAAERVSPGGAPGLRPLPGNPRRRHRRGSHRGRGGRHTGGHCYA